MGLIISGVTSVHDSGQTSQFQNSIARDEFVSGFKRVTRAVHDRGAQIAMQLGHGGGMAKLQTKDLLPLAPSIVENGPYYSGEHRALTDNEIWEIIRAYGDGAQRAKEAGFDAIQIHGAHGYLPSQFLSPYTNQRRDQWGGNLQNRLRIHCEIYKEIRKKVGEDYPIFIKIGVLDDFPYGLEFNEGKEASKLLANLGFNSLEISRGLLGSTPMKASKKEAYNARNWCREVKCQTDIPIMMVGGLRTLSLMEEIIQNNEADFISLSRPLICEPCLINDFKTGERKKARCISCNKCLIELSQGKPLSCAQDRD